jgi:hypothetical protein
MVINQLCGILILQIILFSEKCDRVLKT